MKLLTCLLLACPAGKAKSSGSPSKADGDCTTSNNSGSSSTGIVMLAWLLIIGLQRRSQLQMYRKRAQSRFL